MVCLSTAVQFIVRISPIVVCTKILINAGIKRIVYANPYPDKLAEDMMAASGIEICVLDKK